jgi:hypothetical protein
MSTSMVAYVRAAGLLTRGAQNFWYAVQARKLMKELQAQLAAADAAAALDACMARRPCGSAALKAAISKAEAAASAIAGVTTPSSSGAASAASSMISSSAAAAGCLAFSEALVCRLQAGKKRLEVERASEALHKASVLYKGVGDLPKLEAAILNARKVSSSRCPAAEQATGTAVCNAGRCAWMPCKHARPNL